MRVQRLALTILSFSIMGAIVLNLKPETIPHNQNTGFTAQDMIVPIPKYKIAEPTPKPHNKTVSYCNSVIRGSYIDRLPITVVEMKTTSIGRHFITAYCPAECGGSWQTASGETCHRADHHNRLNEPTTCAIDRKYHKFGDLFYIPEFDRVFVAEDTGAFGGRWLDLFYEEYSDVLSFPTGYYEVYSVEYRKITFLARDYDVIKKVQEVLVYDECKDYQAGHKKGRVF